MVLTPGWEALHRAPSQKLSPLSHRTCPPEDTEARLDSLARHVPITRVADLTPLDRLQLPVFSATTPLATDLTTHLGKGRDRTSARVSAMSEAVERFAAESRHFPSLLTGSFDSLQAAGDNPCDPASLELPSDSNYTPQREYRWFRGWDLLQDSTTLLPLDLVCSPPAEGLLTDVDTNGLAAGNTLLEAVVHGLCEVIERDCLGQLLFVSAFGEPQQQQAMDLPIDSSTLPPGAMALVAQIERAGQSLELSQIVSDIDVPVIRCRIIDPEFPHSQGSRRRIFPGFGASPCAEIALYRAITEAVQSRLAVIQGARDSYNSLSLGRASHDKSAASVAGLPFDSVSSFSSTDLLHDLDYLLRQLRNAGFGSVVAADVSHPDMALAVVRVRVPGLTSFAVNRRRAGWRCLRHLV
ncbi:hypothetical protein E2F43_06985 [Seongchinamella unica]|uniref:YcaO domain-containing protein n=1 Tax=Seongchinamella unica TaxID=2547392 RepID=A0A4R5LWV0_9GAMM|nr:YcaO-like family protein [Seongchinamella unica]TDG15964.1 hypothetical protein E2F43_06985 [Seongchinamella unica]